MKTSAQPRSRPGAPHRGMTLVEFLIALTLVAVIMSLVFATLRIGMQSWERADLMLERSETLRVSQGFLRRTAAQARAVFVGQEDDRRVAFWGEPRLLRFVAPIPNQQGRLYGLYLYTVQLLDEGDGHVELQVDYAPFPPDLQADESVEPDDRLVLARGMKSGRFAYFGPVGRDTASDWRDAWEPEDRLPELVRISLQPEGDEDAAWTLVIPVRGGAMR